MALAVSEVRLGDCRLFTGIVHDLSARVQAEEALRQAHDELEQRVRDRTAALQEANGDIRRFANIVSHDLRAPLINLHGFADELRDACTVLTMALPAVVPHLEGRQGAEVTRALEDDIPEALGFIETSVTRMDHLIEAVLQLSRLGWQELHREPVATDVLVHETLRTLAHQIAQRQVQVTVGGGRCRWCTPIASPWRRSLAISWPMRWPIWNRADQGRSPYRGTAPQRHRVCGPGQRSGYCRGRHFPRL